MGNLCVKVSNQPLLNCNLLELFEWFDTYTFQEYQSALNEYSTENNQFTTNPENIIELTRPNVQKFLNKLSSVKQNSKKSPIDIITFLPQLTQNESGFYSKDSFLSIGIIFCKETTKYEDNVSHLKLLSLTNNTFMETFVNELLKIYILLKCNTFSQPKEIININEYNYRRISNDSIVKVINNKISNAIMNNKTLQSLQNAYPNLNKYVYKNFFLEICNYFYEETFQNETYIQFDTSITNAVPLSIKLKEDNNSLMNNMNNDLKYLNQFSFIFYMNCLVAFDSQEKGNLTQLASTDLETLLSQKMSKDKSELFFKYYFTKENDNADMKSAYETFINTVTTLIKNFESNKIKCGINTKIEVTKLTLAILGLLYTKISDCDKLRFICALLMKGGNIRKKNVMCDTLFLTCIYLSNTILEQYSNLYEEGNAKGYEDRISSCKNRIVQTSFGDSEELELSDFIGKLIGMETNFTTVYFRKQLDPFNS